MKYFTILIMLLITVATNAQRWAYVSSDTSGWVTISSGHDSTVTCTDLVISEPEIDSREFVLKANQPNVSDITVYAYRYSLCEASGEIKSQLIKHLYVIDATLEATDEQPLHISAAVTKEPLHQKVRSFKSGPSSKYLSRPKTE